MEFKLSEARIRELARIEEEAGCEIQAGTGWDQDLARSIANGKAPTETAALSFVIYRDSADQYRWRCTEVEGRVIAESVGAYASKADCEAEILWFQRSAPNSQISA